MNINYIGYVNDTYLLKYEQHPKYTDKFICEYLDKVRIRGSTDPRLTSNYQWFLDIALFEKKQLDKFLNNGKGILKIQDYEKSKMYDNYKQAYQWNSFLENKMKIKESILDPVRDKLNPNIWDNDNKLLPKVKEFIIKVLDDWKISTKFPYEIVNLIFAGSNTGYQYIESSDIDIKLQIDATDDKVKEFSKLLPNGNLLPNTKHPINYYILNKPFDLENKGSIYDIYNDKWLVEPNKEENSISMPYIVELAKVFMVGIDDRVKEYERDVKEIEMYMQYLTSDRYDKVEVEKYIERKKIEIEAGLDGLNVIFDMIHRFRDEGYQQEENPRDFFMFDKVQGHYSIQNQVYKLLEKFGYLDILYKYSQIKNKFLKFKENKISNLVEQYLKSNKSFKDILNEQLLKK